MQLFAGELTNQNREYYKVNDNLSYFTFRKLLTSLESPLVVIEGDTYYINWLDWRSLSKVVYS